MCSKPAAGKKPWKRCAALLVAALAAGCVAVPVSRQGSPVAPHAAQRPVAAPQLVRMPDGYYRVARPWNVALHGRVWRVPAGFRSNGITAPPRVRKALGDGVRHPETWAAVFHDWLFKQPGMSRDRADRMFFDLLVAYGVPEQKARVMYTTVSAYSLSKKFR